MVIRNWFGVWKISGSIYQDGNAVLGRVGIAKEVVRSNQFRTGLELNIQNGNSGRLDVPQAELDQLGGLPIEANLKSMIDLLLASKFYPRNNHEFVFTFIKAGIILRRWEFIRCSVNDLTRVDPELQIGIGYDINRIASISMAYQGVFGKNPNFQVRTSEDCVTRGHVSGIPSLHGILLTLSVHLDEGVAR